MGLVHELLLGNSEILTRVNYQYRDEFAFTDDNFGYIQDMSNLEANITWVTPLEGLSLSLYGRNLFDEVQAGGDTQLPLRRPELDRGAPAVCAQPDRGHLVAVAARPEHRDRGAVRILMLHARSPLRGRRGSGPAGKLRSLAGGLVGLAPAAHRSVPRRPGPDPEWLWAWACGTQ